MISIIKLAILMTLTIFLSGCNSDKKEKIEHNASLGEDIFNKNCVQCHGSKGSGLAVDWRIKDENGNFPAPPLNGTAHTWHHSPEDLLYTINNGGAGMGGKMPGFSNSLSEAEKKSLLTYIYSLWPSDIQKKYDSRFN